jgi:hypothetical protein
MSHVFPIIEPSQYTLLHAEVDTGIVLTAAGARAIGAESPYIIFDTFATLEAYALAKIQSDPDIECVAYDYQQIPIKVFRNDAAIDARVRPYKKPWWRFWS